MRMGGGTVIATTTIMSFASPFIVSSGYTTPFNYFWKVGNRLWIGGKELKTIGRKEVEDLVGAHWMAHSCENAITKRGISTSGNDLFFGDQARIQCVEGVVMEAKVTRAIRVRTKTRDGIMRTLVDVLVFVHGATFGTGVDMDDIMPATLRSARFVRTTGARSIEELGEFVAKRSPNELGKIFVANSHVEMGEGGERRVRIVDKEGSIADVGKTGIIGIGV